MNMKTAHESKLWLWVDAAVFWSTRLQNCGNKHVPVWTEMLILFFTPSLQKNTNLCVRKNCQHTPSPLSVSTKGNIPIDLKPFFLQVAHIPASFAIFLFSHSHAKSINLFIPKNQSGNNVLLQEVFMLTVLKCGKTIL